MKTKASLTTDELKKHIHYDPVAGIFTCISGFRHLIGQQAGWSKGGYRMISVNDVHYQAHRLAWLYVHGEWPKHNIDHINGKKGDNRIENLRDVVQRVNVENARKPGSDNSTGYLGVSLLARAPGKFVAAIRVGRRMKYLGLYATAQEAHAVYVQAKRRLHEGCTI